ncbi:MAG: right-handed parallel beta-helix repeat-containing protein [Candidatus Bathyarchaeota archaeon]|nr:right-handed parallel beta-helix repeat-containing protein [Candidatus Bathyarchaeota archaeon]
MRRKLVLVIGLTVVLIGMLGVTIRVQRVKASGTIYIRADGSVDPDTASISSADNITYTFTANIYDEIVVERDNIVVDGADYTVQGTGNGIGIDLSFRSNVTIKNIEIRKFGYGIYLNHSVSNSIVGSILMANGGESIRIYESSNNNITRSNIMANDVDGIVLYGSSNNTIANNDIRNNYDGIRLYESSNNIIVGNILGNNYYGIWLSSSNNITISGNNITNNRCGIGLSSSNNNTISGNTFLNDGLYVKISYGNVVTGNLVNGKPLVYLEGVSDYVVKDAGQVILVNCSGIRVEKLNLSNTTVGIELWGTNNTRISGNDVTNDSDGVRVESSYNNTVSGNYVTGNNYDGIRISDSSNNIISGNSITNNGVNGVMLSGSSNNTVTGNNITENNYAGIYLYSSSGNTIYHNNFVDNNRQVYDLSWHRPFPNVPFPNVTFSINVWDNGYPSGGNYWSDYIATANDTYSGPFQDETGSDGTGDTAYTIDANNTDNYPLMGMFSDFNATSEHHVQTICNSSISDFQLNGTAISFNVSGENGTTGFCRICIPRALVNETYKVFVNGTEVPHTLLPCSNSTHSYLYFIYEHSTQEVIIIPEFPSFRILPPFMIATLLAVIVYRRHTV